jgi:hypothetical protein
MSEGGQQCERGGGGEAYQAVHNCLGDCLLELCSNMGNVGGHMHPNLSEVLVGW